jgi:predicted RecB family nuclease
LYYDIEGEMGHEFEYLHGVWEVNTKTGEKQYVSFITSDINKELNIWSDFVSYVKKISQKGSFQIIYFADYERVAWNNLSEKAETSGGRYEIALGELN